MSCDYDNNGNIIAEYKQGVNGAKTLRYSYVYDELNQLVRVNDKVANTTYVYEYDGAGNILSKSEYIYTTDETITDEAEKVTNYTYDTVWKDKLATYDGKEFTYDNIGNPLTFDGASFSWSGRELTTYSKDGKTISFQYDENGLRHRKTITENDVITEQYDYVWSDGVLISQTYFDIEDDKTVFTASAKFIYDSWGTLQGFILNDSETYLYVKNLQGDIIAIVDELGEVILEYSYDAWGNVTFHETSLQNMVDAATLCFVSPFAYRGYCYDYDIELYYLQSRYYSAEIGRFINTDDTQIAVATMGTVLGANLFAYCENNAVNRIDPSGYIAITTVIKIALGALTGAAGYLIEWFACKYVLKLPDTSFSVASLLLSIGLGALDGLLSCVKVNSIISFAISFISTILTTISSSYSVVEVLIISLVIAVVSSLISNGITKGSRSLKEVSRYNKQVSSAWKKSIKKKNFKIVRDMLHKYFTRMKKTFLKYINSSLISSMFGTAFGGIYKKIIKKGATA